MLPESLSDLAQLRPHAVASAAPAQLEPSRPGAPADVREAGYRWRRATPGIQLIESGKSLIFAAILGVERGLLAVGRGFAGVGQAAGFGKG
jgi:hypothetical protein